MIIHQVYNWVRVVQEKSCFVGFFLVAARVQKRAHRWIVYLLPSCKSLFEFIRILGGFFLIVKSG